LLGTFPKAWRAAIKLGVSVGYIDHDGKMMGPPTKMGSSLVGKTDQLRRTQGRTNPRAPVIIPDKPLDLPPNQALTWETN